jgi:DNA-binding response OmpR family regulator
MCAMYDAKRIMVIDDDIDLLMLLERSLQKHGYLVETAASLPEAEEIIPEFLPDLVLLDINVKGQDGRKLCWKLKNTSLLLNPKVIIMSGFDLNSRLTYLFGADDMLVKPFPLEYLFHRMLLHFEVKESSHWPIANSH